MAAAVGGFAAWVAMRVHGIAARVGFALGERLRQCCCPAGASQQPRCLLLHPRGGLAHAVATMPTLLAVEGFVFALSPRSIATVLAAELAAFGVVAGPRAPLKVAAGTLVALGTLQTWRWLILVGSVS